LIFGNLMQTFAPPKPWDRGRFADALWRTAALPVRASRFDRMRGRIVAQTSIIDLAEALVE